jgi:hypothetical protein
MREEVRETRNVKLPNCATPLPSWTVVARVAVAYFTLILSGWGGTEGGGEQLQTGYWAVF